MSSRCRVYDLSLRLPPGADARSQPAKSEAESQDGQDRLVLEHLGLARKLANRYAGRGEPLEELTQVAMLGLVQAAQRFDPDRGTSFSSFAVPTILGEIRRYFRDQCWAVRVPRPVHDLYLEIQRAQDHLTTELQRAPTVRELARKLRATEEQIIEAQEGGMAYTAMSLDAPERSNDADGWTLGDKVGGDDDRLELLEDRETVRDLLRQVPDRERTILVRCFYGNRTQAEIAKELGISQMHVSRLLANTLAKLRRAALDPDGAQITWPARRPNRRAV